MPHHSNSLSVYNSFLSFAHDPALNPAQGSLTCSSAVFYPGQASAAPLDSFHRLSSLKIRSKSCVISLPLEFHFTSYGEHYCDTLQDTCEGFPLLFCFMEKFVSCPSVRTQMPRIPILMGRHNGPTHLVFVNIKAQVRIIIKRNSFDITDLSWTSNKVLSLPSRSGP